MENNCLVTKLKANVNDNSLLKVGEMFIDIIEQETPTNITNRLYLNSSSDLIIEVENGEANITLDSNMESGWTNKITLPYSGVSPAPVFVRNGNYRLKVLSKYNLLDVGRYTGNINQKAISVDTKYLKYSHGLVNIYSILSGDISNLIGCTKLKTLGWSYTSGSEKDVAYKKLTGNLSDLASLTTLTSIRLPYSKLTGSLSDLAPLTALTGINFDTNQNITGSLSDLAPLTALTSINVSGCKNITGTINDLTQPLVSLDVYYTQVTGELIEFVKTQRSVGRTTGSCKSGWWGNKITFNGSVPSQDKHNLSWTENTITLGDITVNQ